MSDPALDKDFLAILLTRNWVAGEMAKAQALNLPSVHLGLELLVQGAALLFPGSNIDQVRVMVNMVVKEFSSAFVAALEAGTKQPAGNVVALNFNREKEDETSRHD